MASQTNGPEGGLKSVPASSFDALGVDKWIVASLAAMQIRCPTPIQAQTIPAILAGADCIGGSQTGAGKKSYICGADSSEVGRRWVRHIRVDINPNEVGGC